MFRDTRIHLLAIGLLGLAVSSSSTLAQQTEADLLATLRNADAPIFDKTIACKRLATVGTEAAVPVLAELLQDKQLSHYARYALEPIPSPKVDEALLAALGTLKGRDLIGVINSLANRGKPAAIGPLSKLLDGTDRTVATAAAHSIARLGTPAANEILDKAMSAEFAPACLVCGKTLAEQGHKAEGVAMLVKVYEMQDAPKHVRLAAMVQAVDVQQRDGVKMLASVLASDDKHTFNMALRTARLLEPADASQAVRDAVQQATPSRTALLVTLLGDLGDAASLSAVVEAAGSDDTTVRLAAIEALVTLGGAAHVPLLMDAAGDESETISAQGLKTLAALGGDDVDRAVLELIDDKSRQATVIRLIGQRRITAAVPKLLILLNGPNRLDVIGALGETAALGDLDVLGKILRSKSEELRLAARTAIHAACNRMPERDATAARLGIFLNGASEETVEFLMEELRLIGGPKALATVAAAAKGRSTTQKEYATQALGGWLDTSAAPVLLDLAKTEGSSKYGIRGMRGYIRLIRQFSMPERQRAEMCRTALQTARRDAEKKLVLEVLERYPNVDSLKIAVAAAKDPALKTEAAATALIIAQQIGGKSADVKTLLAQVGHGPVEIEIVKAEYGAGTKVKDVTTTLRRHARDFPLIVLPSPKYNTVFGGDPAAGTVKTLKIQYKINGKPGEVVLPENATILLPTPR